MSESSEHPATDRREAAARRPLDVPSLVAGVVVLVLCAAFALGDLDALDVQARVVGPTVLLGIGVAVLVSGRRSR